MKPPKTVAKRICHGKADRVDVYPLSAGQMGMLYEVLSWPGECMLQDQILCDIQGRIDVNCFVGAWEKVTLRHSALRSGVVVGDDGAACQVVTASALPTVIVDDFRHVCEQDKNEMINRVLNRETSARFRLDAPPLWRVALLLIEEDRSKVIVASHHIMLDGWSFGIVIREVCAIYQALQSGRGTALPAPVPYRRYIDWLARRNLQTASEFWQHALRGEMTEVKTWQLESASPPARRTHRHVVRLSNEETTCIVHFGKDCGVTMATILQGVWALVLAALMDTAKVVYGCVYSGRSASVDGIERLVGSTINVLPVRIHVTGNDIKQWLARIQEDHQNRMRHEYCSLAQIKQWIAPSQLSIESVLAFMNNEVPQGIEDRELRIVKVDYTTGLAYPIAINVDPGDTLSIRVMVDRPTVSEQCAADLAELVKIALASLCNRVEYTVEGVLSEVRRVNERLAEQRSLDRRLSIMDFPISPGSPACRLKAAEKRNT